MMSVKMRISDLKRNGAIHRRVAAFAFVIGAAVTGGSAAHADLIVGGTTALFRITDAGVVSTFSTGGAINGARGLALGSNGLL